MSEARYNVIFHGKIQDEQNLETTKQKLAALYKYDVTKVERLFFTGKTVILKKNFDVYKSL